MAAAAFRTFFCVFSVYIFALLFIPGGTSPVRGEALTPHPVSHLSTSLPPATSLLPPPFSPPLALCGGQVDAAAKRANAGTVPPPEELYADIYADGKGGAEAPPYIRMPDTTKSIGAHPFVN